MSTNEISIYHVSRIPECTKESIDAWVADARPVGGFLRAVLENDLRGAFNRADLDNTRAMPAIMNYLWNDVPSICWGDKKRVEEWPRHFEIMGISTESDEEPSR